MTQAPAPPRRTSEQRTSAAQPRNGLGIAALACGLVGIFAGFIPLLFIVTGSLAILAVFFGIVGIRRARSGDATNGPVAIAGLIAGLIALGMLVWGLSVVYSGLSRLDTEFDHIGQQGTSQSAAQRVIDNQEHRMIRQGMFIGNS